MDCHQGLPFFPHDHPDTQAGTQLAADLAAEAQGLRAKRPKGRFPAEAEVSRAMVAVANGVSPTAEVVKPLGMESS